MDEGKNGAVSAYISAYNRYDVDGMMSPLADDVVFEHFTGDEVVVSVRGKTAFRRLAERAAAMLDDREISVLAMEEDGDTIVARVRYRGSPRGGPILAGEGRSVFVFRDGQILRVTDHS